MANIDVYPPDPDSAHTASDAEIEDFLGNPSDW
jgi:hypothetical protein